MPQRSDLACCDTRSGFSMIIALHCFGVWEIRAASVSSHGNWFIIFTFASTALTFVHYTQKTIDTQVYKLINSLLPYTATYIPIFLHVASQSTISTLILLPIEDTSSGVYPYASIHLKRWYPREGVVMYKVLKSTRPKSEQNITTKRSNASPAINASHSQQRRYPQHDPNTPPNPQ